VSGLKLSSKQSPDLPVHLSGSSHNPVAGLQPGPELKVSMNGIVVWCGVCVQVSGRPLQVLRAGLVVPACVR